MNLITTRTSVLYSPTGGGGRNGLFLKNASVSHRRLGVRLKSDSTSYRPRTRFDAFDVLVREVYGEPSEFQRVYVSESKADALFGRSPDIELITNRREH